EWLISILGNSAYSISAERDCFLQPLLCCTELAWSIASQVGYDLKSHSLATALTQVDHRLDAPQPAFCFNIGMAAYGNGALGQTGVESPLRASHNFCGICRCRESPIPGGGALKCAHGIGNELSCTGFVEMLMGVNEAWYD